MPILTHFTPDVERSAILKECMANYGAGEEDAEWPNNTISRQTVVYGNGTIARANNPVIFSVDSDELNLCIELAYEASALMRGVDVGVVLQ